MDFNMFDDLNVDSGTERNLIELAAVFNSLTVNNPDVDLSCMTEKISDLLRTMNALFEKNKSLSVKNDELYCKNLELDSFIETVNENKQTELNDSLQLQNCVVEENEVLSSELKLVKGKVSNLKVQLTKLNEENSYLKSCVDKVPDGNVPCNDEVSQLRKRVVAYQENIHTLISKFDQVVKTNNKLLSQLDGVKLQNSTSVYTNKWLDDSILQSYFSSFKTHPAAIQSNTLFIDPSVSEIFKLGGTDEVNKQLKELKCDSYNFVFCSVSNSKGSQSSDKKVIAKHDEGSHWSLLFCDMVNKVAYHLDSIGNMNVRFASNLASKFGCTLESVACYQQNNGFECGLNVLINSKLILHYYCSDENNKSSFLEWFGKCTSCINRKPMSQNVQLVVPKRCTSLFQKKCVSVGDKLAIRLRKDDSNTWHVVKTKKGKKSKTPSLSPVGTDVSNRFSSLPDLSLQSIPTDSQRPSEPQRDEKSYQKSHSKSHTRKTPALKQHPKPSTKTNHFKVTPSSARPSSSPKISIYGDSQARHLSEILTSMVKKDQFDVSSIFKPNAKMEQVLSGIEMDRDLSADDVIVIVGGTNNVNIAGHCNDFTTVVNSFLAEVSKPKVLLVGLPPRHDKPSFNSTISKTNSHLLSISKLYSNVVFVSLEHLPRQCFTKQGLHLNPKGKTFLAGLLLKTLNIQPFSIVPSDENPDKPRPQKPQTSKKPDLFKPKPPKKPDFPKPRPLNKPDSSKLQASHNQEPPITPIYQPNSLLKKPNPNKTFNKSNNPGPPSHSNHIHPYKSKRPPIPRPSAAPSNRSFFNKDFLGEARKPPGIPWALYLKGDWGVLVRP